MGRTTQGSPSVAVIPPGEGGRPVRECFGRVCTVLFGIPACWPEGSGVDVLSAALSSFSGC